MLLNHDLGFRGSSGQGCRKGGRKGEKDRERERERVGALSLSTLNPQGSGFRIYGKGLRM